VYSLEYLPLAVTDILQIDACLYEFSPAAADKFTDTIQKLTETLTNHPLMYQIYDGDDYFRCIVLPYKHRLFYHVVEETKTIKIHRILHGMRDIKSIMDSES
jgi:plasmid stabilization system protein ParE